MKKVVEERERFKQPFFNFSKRNLPGFYFNQTNFKLKLYSKTLLAHVILKIELKPKASFAS